VKEVEGKEVRPKDRSMPVSSGLTINMPWSTKIIGASLEDGL
jgi:hypothetical protein